MHDRCGVIFRKHDRQAVVEGGQLVDQLRRANRTLDGRQAERKGYDQHDCTNRKPHVMGSFIHFSIMSQSQDRLDGNLDPG